MGIVAFILIFTLVSVDILYEGNAAATLFPGQFASEKFDAAISFETFIQCNWEISKDDLTNGGQGGAREQLYWAYHADVQYHMQRSRDVNPDVFKEYSTGIEWYRNEPYLREGSVFGVSTQPRAVIRRAYEDYLNDNGLFYSNISGITEIEKGWLDRVLDTAAMIPEGITNMIDVATFNFKDKYGNEEIPLEVRTAISLCMAPLWIIMFIGILPYLIEIVKAFAAVLDAITPFT
jgi:hypothetical protein